MYSLDWSFAYDAPLGACQFKQQPQDFIVEEILPFEPEGEGEHLLLFIEKIGENTDWVAGLLAKHAGVAKSAVSYAGRKDRHGVTRQWFCATLPGLADPDWTGFESDTIRILQQSRHRKKLKTGALKGNHFIITLRGITADTAQVEERLQQIIQAGVPNYFGEQRFGYQGRNVAKAVDMMQGKFRLPKNKRSIYLSAARAWLFNHVLSNKVADGSWNQYLSGDVLGFPDSNSLIFDVADDALLARLAQGEISATSPLWGRGLPKVQQDALVLEQQATISYSDLCDGLERAGLNQERRVNRLIPQHCTWVWQDNQLILRFTLPKGTFATTVLRELFECIEPSREQGAAE